MMCGCWPGTENHLLVDEGLLRDPEPKYCICLGHDGQSARACIFGASESPLIELVVVPKIFGWPQQQSDYLSAVKRHRDSH